jgi:hypothetical protein
MFALLQCPRHRHGHLLLLRTKFKILRLRQNTRRRKKFFDLFYKINACTGRLVFDDRDHLVYRKGAETERVCRKFPREQIHLQKQKGAFPVWNAHDLTAQI